MAAATTPQLLLETTSPKILKILKILSFWMKKT
jgi:hypothetical protein